MDRTTPTTHAGHDELLVARLFGGDLDTSERGLALDQLANCPDCAALFADLGAIASATAALPVPPRPRDFTLTVADAARLGAGRRRLPAFLRPELRRSFGGVLAALGLVGVVLTGGFSVFGGVAGTTSSDQSNRNSLAADQAAAGGVASLAPAAQPAASAAATYGGGPVFGPLDSTPIPAAASSDGVVLNGGQGPISAPEPSGLKAVTSGNPDLAVQASAGGSEADGRTRTSHSTSPGASTASSGMDARLVWLIGFAVLFGVGLAILILPSMFRRRGRGSRS
jgi:anti-sigma factor RsiW